MARSTDIDLRPIMSISPLYKAKIILKLGLVRLLILF